MAYGLGLLSQIEQWVDAGLVPGFGLGNRVAELGSQMVNPGTPIDAILRFIRTFKPAFDGSEISDGLPVNSFGIAYAAEIWRRCGVDYVSYDITEAPHSRLFDLNFHTVPEQERQSADLVTNIGTTEHVANQLNAFRTIHDLLKVGGVAIHSVPFAGMLNHALFNYQPKFFFSLIVNNRYRLRYVELTGPSRHESLGVANTIFDGDYLPATAKLPGSQAWSKTPLYSGTINLVIERRFPDEFVPPVDFAKGYFGDMPLGDLSALVGVDNLPHNAWADAYRRTATPTQTHLR
jgi:hypothetical protein